MPDPYHPTAMPEPNDLFGMHRLPGRLNAEHAAALLGFALHDISILIREKLLRPLGKPAPNAPKWFASVDIEQIRQDPQWLSTATKVLSDEWKRKRQKAHKDRPHSSV